MDRVSEADIVALFESVRSDQVIKAVQAHTALLLANVYLHNVTDRDTSAFAVQTLRRWWATIGKGRYPDADRLLICADGGGSNGSRSGASKIELAKFAAVAGLQVTVCHLPPGTSRWNKIEHRLFRKSP